MFFTLAHFARRSRERDFIRPRETIFRHLLSSVIHETSLKPDLSSGSHMGNQTLPSIPAASPSSAVGKMFAGASQQCEITPQGGQRKGSQPKSVTWIPFSVPHLSGALHRARQGIWFLFRTLKKLLQIFFTLSQQCLNYPPVRA